MHESALKRDRGPHRPSGSHWYWILSSGAIFRAGIKGVCCHDCRNTNGQNLWAVKGLEERGEKKWREQGKLNLSRSRALFSAFRKHRWLVKMPMPGFPSGADSCHLRSSI